jgi:hypothetical protein
MGLFGRQSSCRRSAHRAGRWAVALPLIAISIAVGEGKAVAAVNEPAASATTAAPASQRDEPTHRARKSVKAERRRHQLVHHVPSSDDLSDVVAKARPADANAKAPPADVVVRPPPMFPPPLPPEDTLGLEPRSVPTVKFSAAGPARLPPPDAPQADASAAVQLAGASQVTVGNAGAPPAVTVIDVPPPVEARGIAPLLEMAAPLRAITTTERLMLFGGCGLGALGGYAALAAYRRRRERAAAGGEDSQSLSVASGERHADRVARQRLFPHQFGTAIRG